MKKNSFDLTVPNRESPLAILFILIKTIYNIITRIWPALLVFLFRGKSDHENTSYLLIAVIVVTLVAMIFSFINYFKTYYYINNNELYLEKGVLQKTKTNIPFERIQSVQFEQNIFHTILNVVKLKMDTAGSDKTEIDFYAIEKEKAEWLRNTILSYKEKLVGKNETEDIPSTQKTVGQEIILQVGMRDLLKVGLTRNHLKSGGVILIFLAWLYDNIKDLGLNADEYYEEVVAPGSDFRFYIYLTLIFLLASVIISMVRSVIAFFDLRFIRVSQGFHMVAGLFTKKETSALDQKIQMISWSDNLLKRQLGYYDVRLHQAASHEMNRRQNPLIPGMNTTKIEDLCRTIFKVRIPSKSDGKNIQPAYFRRYFVILSILFVGVVITLLWLQIYFPLVVLTVFYSISVLSRYLQYKKKNYKIKEDSIVIRGGAFGEKNVIFPVFKIQGIEISQSPYQRRQNLADVAFHLASGSVYIPYITKQEADVISDYCLYKIESSSKKWM
ncbi:MAG: PH domain-containing protein [Saprospiraceae bacterium]|nr:PH domain-containing protein [Saprospiraceae bacterium]